MYILSTLPMITTFVWIVFSLVLIILPQVHATGTPADTQLASIVDFNQALGQETPAQFASQNLQNAMHTKNVTVDPVVKDPALQALEDERYFQGALGSYIIDVYNKPGYTTGLSQDSSHLIHFLTLGKELSIRPSMIYVALRLFNNKMKGCEVIDDAAILQIVQAAPSLLSPYFLQSPDAQLYDLAFIKRHLHDMLFNRFTEHLRLPQQDPNMLIAHLTQDLVAQYEQEMTRMQKQAQHEAARERLRTLLIRFFELSLNKCIWNPTAPHLIWPSFKTLAEGFEVLARSGVIDQMDDLDDLYWSLVHRFCFFLDLYGSALPLSVYEEIESNLTDKNIFFLEYKEQDEGILTKKETLAEALILGRTRAYAYANNGIISLPVGSKKADGQASIQVMARAA